MYGELFHGRRGHLQNWIFNTFIVIQNIIMKLIYIAGNFKQYDIFLLALTDLKIIHN
jgi:hypothetical protein